MSSTAKHQVKIFGQDRNLSLHSLIHSSLPHLWLCLLYKTVVTKAQSHEVILWNSCTQVNFFWTKTSYYITWSSPTVLLIIFILSSVVIIQYSSLHCHPWLNSDHGDVYHRHVMVQANHATHLLDKLLCRVKSTALAPCSHLHSCIQWASGNLWKSCLLGSSGCSSRKPARQASSTGLTPADSKINKCSAEQAVSDIPSTSKLITITNMFTNVIVIRCNNWLVHQKLNDSAVLCCIPLQ